jgi:hypothetical protein
MVGEGIAQSPEERALAATQAYMAFGAETEIGHIPAVELQALATETEGVKLPTYAAYNAGWLYIETAISTYRENPDGGWNEHYEPLALLEKSKSIWKAIYLDPSKPVLYRAKAEVAAGSLEVYETLVSEKASVDQRIMWDRQVAAGAALLRTLDKHRSGVPDIPLVHEAHCQTLMLLLGRHLPLSNIFGIPAPARFQEVDSDRRYDMLLSVWINKSHHFHYLRVAAQSGGAEEGCIVIHPDQLRNEGYEPRAGHGTLRAILEEHQGKNRRVERPRRHHHQNAYADLLKDILLQRTTLDNLNLGVDAVTGMESARQWYRNLPPDYRLTAEDKAALENCINPHEYALGKDDTPVEDIQRLGWLWGEVASISEGGEGFDRAIQVFELAGETAVEQENWPGYVESMMGAAAIKLRQMLHGEQRPSLEQFISYLGELAGIAEGMQRGFSEINERSPHLPELKRLARILTACMVMNATTETDLITTFPSHRQQALGGTRLGSDLLVIPEIKDRFKLARAGKLRFAPTAENTLDKGIMTLTPDDLARNGWQDDLELLGRVANEIRWIQFDSAAFEPDELLEEIRAFLLDRAALTMAL